MTPAIGTAAACSKVTVPGLEAICRSLAQTSSAQAPEPTQPNTSSPGAKPVTSAPTASTTPATSAPGIGSFGTRSPAWARAMYGVPVVMCQSYMLSDDARTRISTWSAAGSGTATSRSSRTSGRPYRSWTIALIVFLAVLV